MDRELIERVLQRARLASRIKRGAAMDAADEKALWAAWRSLIPAGKGEAARWRKLFTILQELEPPREDAAPADEEHGFRLVPRRGPYALTLDAPPEAAAVQALALAMTAFEQPCALGPVLVNEPLVQTVKALNQADARLYWEHETLAVRGPNPLVFANKAIYAGEDPLAFYGALCLALAEPGSVKFTGGAALKLLDLSALEHLLPRLGGRMVSIVPGAKGLPVRVEASGQPADEVHLNQDIDPDFALALAITATRFPHGITLLASEPSTMMAQRLKLAEHVLTACGAAVSLTDAEGALRLQVQPGPLAPPARPLAMDPLIAAYLLAMARLEPSGASVIRLEGAWTPPMDADPVWRAAASLLRAAGVELATDAHGVTARAFPPSATAEPPRLGIEGVEALYPLAFALGSSLPAAVLEAPPSAEDRFVAQELADLARVDFTGTDDGVRLASQAGRHPGRDAWAAPSPWWALACAGLAFARPGLALADPGMVSDVIPRFWNFYNTLPTPPRQALFAPKPKPAPDNAPERTSRRIRIGHPRS